MPACCAARWKAVTSWSKLLINCQVASSESVGCAVHVAGSWAVLVGASGLNRTAGGSGCGCMVGARLGAIRHVNVMYSVYPCSCTASGMKCYGRGGDPWYTRVVRERNMHDQHTSSPHLMLVVYLVRRSYRVVGHMDTF